jgi:hypothetical protein
MWPNQALQRTGHSLRSRPAAELGVMWPWGLGLTAAQGRIGTVAVTAIYQSLGTKEEKGA